MQVEPETGISATEVVPVVMARPGSPSTDSPIEGPLSRPKRRVFMVPPSSSGGGPICFGGYCLVSRRRYGIHNMVVEGVKIISGGDGSVLERFGE